MRHLAQPRGRRSIARTLLGMPPPNVRAYPSAALIAEKFLLASTRLWLKAYESTPSSAICGCHAGFPSFWVAIARYAAG